MQNYNWYSQIIKPTWAPPAYLFGPVWSVLYTIIFITYGTVFYKVINKEIPSKVLFPVVLNLFFNFLFTPIQFGLRNNLLASIDIIFIWLTIIWFMYWIFKFAPEIKWVVYANIPYLLWVSFATVLQITITILNK